jgi:hypothetical protein
MVLLYDIVRTSYIVNKSIYVFLRRRRQNIRRSRVFRDRDNPLDYTDDADIISEYMLSRPLILNLC